mmetsp:Transcript_3392/g.8399  ORF Transcript_3392/g.8399 Transcript_3392/m.8399 type:complete len:1104 (+) Transcript_3392:62-3373(+)
MASTGKIFRAASTGDTLGVRAALTAGEDVDGVDIGRQAALHWAAMKGHLGVAAVLISRGANLLKKTKKGKTAIDLAKDGGHDDVLDFLNTAYDLQRGRGLTKKGTPKKTPGRTPHRGVLTGAAAEEANAKMVQWASTKAEAYLNEAEKVRAEEHRRRKEAEAANVSSAQRSARQKAEISKLLSVIQQARQNIVPGTPASVSVKGGGGSAKTATPADAAAAASGTQADATPQRPWQSAADVQKELETASPANGANGHTKSAPQSPTRRPPSRGSAQRSSSLKHGSKGDGATPKNVKRSLVQERRQQSASRSAREADARRAAIERKQKEAEERRIAAASAKKAAQESDRVRRLADLEKAKKRREKIKEDTEGAASPGPMTVVSLDGNLGGVKAGRMGATPKRREGNTPSSMPVRTRSPRQTTKGSTTPSTTKGTPAPKTNTSTKATPTTASRLVTPKRSGSSSSTSMLSSDLEDEYLSWVRGMSGGEKGKERPAKKERGPSKLVKTTPPLHGSTRMVTIQRRPDSGLGVGIYSSKAGQYGVSVSSVMPDSPFGGAGVEVGDVFLSIHGTDVSKATHAKAVKLLKAAPERFSVKLWSRLKSRATVPVHARPPAARFDPSLEDKSRVCIIDRGSNDDPLGVALHSDTQDRWVQVHMVVPGGAVDRAGIQSNDVILEIGGKPAVALSHREVVAELNACAAKIEMKVASLDDVVAAQLGLEYEGKSDTMQSSTFTIKRMPDKGLGLAICNLKGKTGVRIRDITPNGPFAKANVPRGSVIVRLDGAVVLDATHAEVVEAMKSAGDSFEITVATEREVEDYVKRRADRSDATLAVTSPSGRPSSTLEPQRFDIRREPKQGLGVALCSNKRRLGVRISQLDPRGPLALAGVKEQDVIVQVDGFPCLKATHDEVVAAFRRAPANFAVVVVPGDEFDQVTPEFGRSPTSTDIEPLIDLDEMRPALQSLRHSNSARRPSHGGSRGEIFIGDSPAGTDDMRTEAALTLQDSRISDALESTEGYLALKRAQEQAMSLKASVDMYEDVFTRSDGAQSGLSARRKTSIPSPTALAGRPRGTPSLNRTVDEDILRVMKQELTPAGGGQRIKVAGRTTARV